MLGFEIVPCVKIRTAKTDYLHHPQATHTVQNGGILKTTVRATATEKTPIMLTQHIYW